MRVLYLSYDGMTDPLGRSQVIPYLSGLAAKGHEITLVSTEKSDRFESARARVQEVLSGSGIDWQPMRYHKKPPILSTVWDLKHMQRLAYGIALRKKIELVHCRSYVPSIAGLRLKRKLGIRFVFDMRGFWADERVDGGLWNLKKPQYQLAYRYFKKMEMRFINESDRIVSLTHAGKAEMLRWGITPEAADRIEVIPCCADLDHFKSEGVSLAERAQWRKELRLSEGDFVVSYLGSLGTWYLLDEMLRFFRILKKARPEAKLLFITPDDPRWIFDAATRAGVDAQAVRVREGSRDEVPGLLSLSGLGLFFIRPSYSKISSSPTKLAEILAMGIPVVTNAGVGDSDWFAARFQVGELVHGFSDEEFEKVIAKLPTLEKIAPQDIRAAAQSYFSLEHGVEAYDRIYTSLERGVE